MSSGGALSRVVNRAAGRAADAVERCDLCAAPVPEQHRHLLDEQTGDLMCACQPCSLLFEREAAARGHYRLVPRRRVHLDAAGLPDALGVPVGLVFFIGQRDGSVHAHYPSPMGVTQSEVDAEAWRRVVQRWPLLAGMEPLVEALLANTARSADEHWLVPVDDCYRLVAVVRRQWRGLSGGREVWPEIDRFFEELRTRYGGRAAAMR